MLGGTESIVVRIDPNHDYTRYSADIHVSRVYFANQPGVVKWEPPPAQLQHGANAATLLIR